MGAARAAVGAGGDVNAPLANHDGSIERIFGDQAGEGNHSFKQAGVVATRRPEFRGRVEIEFGGERVFEGADGAARFVLEKLEDSGVWSVGCGV